MLDAQLDAMDYRNIKMKLEPEIERLNKEISILEYKGLDENEVKEFGFLFLDNLGNLFEDSTLEERHRFLVSTFPEKLFYKNGEFQTISNTDILSLISRSDKAFSEKEKGSKKILAAFPKR